MSDRITEPYVRYVMETIADLLAGKLVMDSESLPAWEVICRWMDQQDAEIKRLRQTAKDLHLLCQRMSRMDSRKNRLDLVSHANRIAEAAGVPKPSILRSETQ